MPKNQTPPEVLVEVSVPYAAWNENDRHPCTVATRAVKETLYCAEMPEHLKGIDTVEVSILLANDDLVRTLNREYRHKDSATNVLSFPQIDYSIKPEKTSQDTSSPGSPLQLGDLILAYETVISESEERMIPFESIFVHLIVHGTLHLLGYDHETEEEADFMEDTEIWILSRMGHKNPYSW